MELAAYVLGDAYGIFTKYPSPKTSTNGQIKVFSFHVSRRNCSQVSFYTKNDSRNIKIE